MRNHDTFQSSGMFHIFPLPPRSEKNGAAVEKAEVSEKPNNCKFDYSSGQPRCQVKYSDPVSQKTENCKELLILRSLNRISIRRSLFRPNSKNYTAPILKVGRSNQAFQKEFEVEHHKDKPQVFGSNPSEKRLRLIHGQLSFHPPPRVESAKQRANLQGNSSVFDSQYKTASLNTFDPKEFRNRHLRSQIDFGQEQSFDYRNKEKPGWTLDLANSQQRRRDHQFSDIFHTKIGEEAALPRSIGLQRQEKDIE